MISIKEMSLAYGARKIFSSVSVVINKCDKIGLAGSNGAGKSTLLKVLAGLEGIDAGIIDKAKYVTAGYLPQDIINASALTLFKEVENSFEDVILLRQHISDADQVLLNFAPETEEYKEALETIGDLQHKLEDMQEEKLKSKIEKVLHGLGFSNSDMQKPCSSFSGGWQMRIALAKLLLKAPTLLMLDEPTNHLDIESVIWLEQYLRSYEGAVIIVSHDRSFLDALTNKTFYLSKGRLETYSGNFSFYEKESALRRDNLLKASLNQQKSIEKTEKFIERFRAKNTKAAQVQSRIKALDKIDRIEIEDEESGIDFRFPTPERSGQVVVKLDGISKSYGNNQVLKNISFQIERGERIAIVGVNGAGKTTLVKIMAGAIAADSGLVELGYNVSMSYFAQHQADELDKNSTVLDEAKSAASMEQKPKVRTLLGSFLFTGDDALKKVAVLSGGEKNRLALAKMLLKSFNFLILDEPTNHLDMNSKTVLQRAIKNYEGTIVVVSHDRGFVDPLVNKVIEVSKTGVKFYLGNVSDYAEKLKERSEVLKGVLQKNLEENSSQKFTSKDRRILVSKINEQISPIKKKAENLESEIAKMEDEKASLEAKMADPEFYKQGGSVASLTYYNELKLKLDEAFFTWQGFIEEIDSLREQMPK